MKIIFHVLFFKFRPSNALAFFVPLIIRYIKARSRYTKMRVKVILLKDRKWANALQQRDKGNLYVRVRVHICFRLLSTMPAFFLRREGRRGGRLCDTDPVGQRCTSAPTTTWRRRTGSTDMELGSEIRWLAEVTVRLKSERN